MKKSVKSGIFFLITLLALSAACIGYYLYNKGPVDVKISSAIKINAGELYDAYIKDSAAAQKKYTGEILAVDGIVHDISVNQQQKKILLLRSNSDGAYINCTLEENAENISPFIKVTIKGICSGIGEGDADLGIKGDVYLTRCYLIKQQ